MADTDQQRAYAERARDPSRVLALSDGVFAIVITLLVLDIHVPDLAEGQALADALQEIRPSFVAFVISFIVAGMYWASHRDLFGQIRRADRLLVWLNILFMLPLCLLPFGASLIGRHDQDAIALRLYGVILVAISIMRTVMWLYVTKHPQLLWQPVDNRQRRAGLALFAGPGVLYILAILTASVAPVVSLVIYGGIPVLYFVGISVLRRGRAANQEYAEFT